MNTRKSSISEHAIEQVQKKSRVGESLPRWTKCETVRACSTGFSWISKKKVNWCRIHRHRYSQDAAFDIQSIVQWLLSSDVHLIITAIVCFADLSDAMLRIIIKFIVIIVAMIHLIILVKFIVIITVILRHFPVDKGGISVSLSHIHSVSFTFSWCITHP